jgi:NADPH:quinone reductase-like Zn-dependent oxidoreductase
MKGFGFAEHGGPEKTGLLEVPEPHPGPGEVKVRVKAASFNHLDLFTLEGIPGVKVPLPHILCGDASGLVESLGEGVEGVHPGDRVMLDPGLSDGTCEYCVKGLECLCRNYQIIGEHTQGAAAEFVVVPARNVVPLPSHLDFVQGAAPALVFMTAWRALMTVGELQGGQSVAIVGAGGGLTTAAIQLAHWRGANVIVVSRSEDRARRAKDLGADQWIVPTPEKPLDRALWEASGKRGIDLVFDSTGKATVPSTVRSLARGGKFVFCGATTGALVEIDLRTLFWRNASLRGSTMATRAEFRQVLELLAEGAVRPVVDEVFPLAEGRKALERLARGEMFGKIVLRVD